MLQRCFFCHLFAPTDCARLEKSLGSNGIHWIDEYCEILGKYRIFIFQRTMNLIVEPILFFFSKIHSIHLCRIPQQKQYQRMDFAYVFRILYPDNAESFLKVLYERISISHIITIKVEVGQIGSFLK